MGKVMWGKREWVKRDGEREMKKERKEKVICGWRDREREMGGGR